MIAPAEGARRHEPGAALHSRAWRADDAVASRNLHGVVALLSSRRPIQLMSASADRRMKRKKGTRQRWPGNTTGYPNPKDPTGSGLSAQVLDGQAAEKAAKANDGPRRR